MPDSMHVIKCSSNIMHVISITLQWYLDRKKNMASTNNWNDLLPAWLPDVADVPAAALA